VELFLKERCRSPADEGGEKGLPPKRGNPIKLHSGKARFALSKLYGTLSSHRCSKSNYNWQGGRPLTQEKTSPPTEKKKRSSLYPRHLKDQEGEGQQEGPSALNARERLELHPRPGKKRHQKLAPPGKKKKDSSFGRTKKKRDWSQRERAAFIRRKKTAKPDCKDQAKPAFWVPKNLANPRTTNWKRERAQRVEGCKNRGSHRKEKAAQKRRHGKL